MIPDGTIQEFLIRWPWWGEWKFPCPGFSPDPGWLAHYTCGQCIINWLCKELRPGLWAAGERSGGRDELAAC